MNRAGLIAAVIFPLICTLARAADVPQGRAEPPPTLHAAVESAYARHPQQQALVARAREAEALELHAGSLIADNPAVGGLYKTDQIGSGDGFREWEAGIYLPLWKPGQRIAAKRVAQSTENSLRQERRALRLAVAGEVRERIWEAVLMENNRSLAEKEWHTADALARDVRRRVELGDLATNDLLLARDDVLTKHAAYLRARMELETARQRYASYTGLPRLPREHSETCTQMTEVPDDHPLLAEALTRVHRAQAQMTVIRLRDGGAPEIFLGGNGERGHSEEDFNSRIAVSLTLPIGIGAHTAPALAAAAREHAEALADYEGRKRELALQRVQATMALESADAELSLATEQNRVTRENLRLARVAFQAGETDLVGLLRAQGLAFAAERRQKELRIVRQRASARCNQADGRLP
nr:TolC family protein [Gammaproteobacteria bacterium]